MKALIIVDVQNDFLPARDGQDDGALAVQDGSDVIPVIKSLLDGAWNWDVVVASQDYHPPKHISFASRHDKEPFTELEVTDGNGKTYSQTMWPDHCVQGTKGAEIDRDLRKSFDSWKDKMKIVRKACYRDVEAYSAFEGYLTEVTDPSEPPTRHASDEMTKHLKDSGVKQVVVVGLATDFCVRQTTLDAISSGFSTVLLAPAARPVFPDKVEQTYEEITKNGGSVIDNNQTWESELRHWLD